MRARRPGIVLAVLVLPAISLAGGCGRPVDVTVAQRFSEAVKRFDQAVEEEDYLEVASIDEEILASGVRSGAVAYNLGNAYWMAGRKGEAIAAYRRALRYRPRDPYVTANLLTALGATAEDVARGRSLVDHVLFWRNWFSYPEKVAGVLGLLTLAALLSLLRRMRSPRGLGFGRAAWAALGFALLLGITAGLDIWNIEIVRHGVVTAEVVARKGNSETYEAAFTEALPEGQEFRVLERRGAWLRIELEGGLAGWIPDDHAVLY